MVLIRPSYALCAKSAINASASVEIKENCKRFVQQFALFLLCISDCDFN